jgi:2-polyprenyl-3-methyl-5-hydroxy-6-metoxy-1,4-benzoquinol methylase
MPAHLKNSAKDTGMSYTKRLVKVQTDYTLDKVLRQHEGKNLTVLDAGAGGGYMSGSLTCSEQQAYRAP